MVNSDSEERYEAIELIIKSRTDAESWFDVISDYLTQDCEGTEDIPCDCGLESMSGSSGTLDQCRKWLGIDDDKVTVHKDDVLLVISQLATSGYKKALPGLSEAIIRLHDECTWWETWLEKYEATDDEGEDE